MYYYMQQVNGRLSFNARIQPKQQAASRELWIVFAGVCDPEWKGYQLVETAVTW